MSYQELLNQAVVKGLGVTFGVILGLVTVTPVLKFLYTERPNKQVEKKKLSKNLSEESKKSNQTSQTDSELFNHLNYKSLFDDMQS